MDPMGMDRFNTEYLMDRFCWATENIKHSLLWAVCSRHFSGVECFFLIAEWSHLSRSQMEYVHEPAAWSSLMGPGWQRMVGSLLRLILTSEAQQQHHPNPTWFNIQNLLSAWWTMKFRKAQKGEAILFMAKVWELVFERSGGTLRPAIQREIGAVVIRRCPPNRRWIC